MMTAVATELTLEGALSWVRRFGTALHENKMYLTRLDADIGDGDHGLNMDRGFLAVEEKINSTRFGDLGALFKLVGSTLISTVGGASGPLYGTAFLRMGGALAGRTSASVPELGAALGVAYDGIAARGKSTRGEKTMLDAFGPALDVFQSAASAVLPLTVVAADAAAAADGGVEATIPMVAMKGRASFLGENSAGHQDPGATSTSLFFRALADTVTS